MRKILILFVLVFSMVALMACEKEDKPIINPDPEKEEEKDPEKEPEKEPEEDSKKYYFTDLEIPEEVKMNETSVFTLKETNLGDVKKNFNPYKSSSISVDCIFTDAEGNEFFRPLYWTQDYKIGLNKLNSDKSRYAVYSDEIYGVDYANKKGDEHFALSFKPLSSGEYKYKLVVYENNLASQTIKGSFNVLANDAEYKGKIVVNDTNERYFMYENTKETYIPIGMNNGWYSSERKSYDYDEWFRRMSDVGCNYSRIWMASWSFGLHIGTGAKVDDFTNRMAAAARLERVLAVAEEKGIYVFLTLINHGQFSKRVNAEWNINTYNTIISDPEDFFTVEACKDAYKDELRYIIARYGTYDSILAWELFNEVDWTDFADLNSNSIKKWHQEMAKYIRENDCYNRLITTSYKGNGGSALKLEEMDISCIHSYAYTNNNAITYTTKEINQNYGTYKKIVMFAEWGLNADSGEKTHALDLKGIALYQSMWSSLLTGGAGSTMTWWWDSYIHKFKMYPIYKGIAAFSKKMDLNGSITYLNSGNVTLPSGLNFIGIKCDDRYYGYIYDKTYTYTNEVVNKFSGDFIVNVASGTYELTLMNPKTGEVVQTSTQDASSGVLTISIPEFETDLAIILTKNN